MSEPYLGEIRMFAGNYAPHGWALCNGQALAISDNDALYSLLGTTYGGNGVTTFALPDLQGRIPIHRNPTYNLGEKGGTETVSLTLQQIPSHTHVPKATAQAGNQPSPGNTVWAASTLNNYANAIAQPPVAMNQHSVNDAGGNLPHDNVMPSLTLSFIIALGGVYPSQG